MDIVATVVNNHKIENNRPAVSDLGVCRQLRTEETRRVQSLSVSKENNIISLLINVFIKHRPRVMSLAK